jgi:hypothetical protein
MHCAECSRLFNQLEVSLAAYKEVARSASGLHGFDLQFHDARERTDTARQRFEECRSALMDHEQHHKKIGRRRSFAGISAPRGKRGVIFGLDVSTAQRTGARTARIFAKVAYSKS